MSGYVRATDFRDEFEGDTVTAKLEPLSLTDSLRLKASEAATEEETAAILADILPKYVNDFVGLKASDGSAISIEEVCSKAYFLQLALAIGKRLVRAAFPPEMPSETSAS